MHVRLAMGRRITLYEAALAEAEATGGITARQVAIAAFEKADFIFRVFHRIREYIAPAFGFLALLVLVALTVDWGLSGFTRDYWNSRPPSAALVRAAGFFGVGFACYSVWDLALLLEKFGIVPGRLKAPALAPFHAVRARCADAETAAFEHDGKLIDGPIFKSVWSLILFSQIGAKLTNFSIFTHSDHAKCVFCKSARQQFQRADARLAGFRDVGKSPQAAGFW